MRDSLGSFKIFKAVNHILFRSFFPIRIRLKACFLFPLIRFSVLNVITVLFKIPKFYMKKSISETTIIIFITENYFVTLDNFIFSILYICINIKRKFFNNLVTITPFIFLCSLVVNVMCMRKKEKKLKTVESSKKIYIAIKTTGFCKSL